jgi:hypothetical protein
MSDWAIPITIPAGDAGIDALAIRARLGRDDWSRPIEFGLGWRYQRYDATAVVLITAATFPELPGIPITHASISRHNPITIPTYEDLCHLHAAAFPDGNAIQCFVPTTDHINICPNVLHLWGRSDGQRLWPIDFGQYGTI